MEYEIDSFQSAKKFFNIDTVLSLTQARFKKIYKLKRRGYKEMTREGPQLREEGTKLIEKLDLAY